MVVICAGGGGIPVIVGEHGGIQGIEAVVDKDHTAALLAEGLGAHRLLILTDVEAVWSHWKTPHARAIRAASPAHLRAMAFEAGSMAPKIDAACRFVDATGGVAMIGALEHAAETLACKAGTRIANDVASVDYYPDNALPLPDTKPPT